MTAKRRHRTRPAAGHAARCTCVWPMAAPQRPPLAAVLSSPLRRPLEGRHCGPQLGTARHPRKRPATLDHAVSSRSHVGEPDQCQKGRVFALSLAYASTTTCQHPFSLPAAMAGRVRMGRAVRVQIVFARPGALLAAGLIRKRPFALLHRLVFRGRAAAKRPGSALSVSSDSAPATKRQAAATVAHADFKSALGTLQRSACRRPTRSRARVST